MHIYYIIICVVRYLCIWDRRMSITVSSLYATLFQNECEVSTNLDYITSLLYFITRIFSCVIKSILKTSF